MSYVITDINGKFLAFRGTSPDQWAWVSEYPDATEMQNRTTARGAMRELRVRGPVANIYSLIENYGQENQRTIERADMLQEKLEAERAQFRKLSAFEDEILNLIDNRDDFTRSDLQGAVSAIVLKIFRSVEGK